MNRLRISKYMYKPKKFSTFYTNFINGLFKSALLCYIEVMRKAFRKLLIALGIIVFTLSFAAVCCFGTVRADANKVYREAFEGFTGRIIKPTGDFMQPWMCEGWEVADFEAHLDILKEAGYDTVLWQYTVVSYGGEANFYYPASSHDGYKVAYADNSALTERLLAAAQIKNFKVFLGLANDDDWWGRKPLYNTDWHLAKADRDNRIAQELYTLYKSRFPDAFYGWYWSWELWTNPVGLEENWANMLNRTRAFLLELEPAMPLLFSPFLSKFLRFEGGMTQRMWKRFFETAEFASGDIFAPQDSIGKISGADVQKNALAATLDYLESCYNASKSEPGLRFYVNCELFASNNLFTPEGGFDTASLARIQNQLIAASRYAEGIITFSYSHFLAPDAPNSTAPDKQKCHEEYVEFIESIS